MANSLSFVFIILNNRLCIVLLFAQNVSLELLYSAVHFRNFADSPRKERSNRGKQRRKYRKPRKTSLPLTLENETYLNYKVTQ